MTKKKRAQCLKNKTFHLNKSRGLEPLISAHAEPFSAELTDVELKIPPSVFTVLRLSLELHLVTSSAFFVFCRELRLTGLQVSCPVPTDYMFRLSTARDQRVAKHVQTQGVLHTTEDIRHKKDNFTNSTLEKVGNVKTKQKAVICKSHKSRFYSQWNVVNLTKVETMQLYHF